MCGRLAYNGVYLNYCRGRIDKAMQTARLDFRIEAGTKRAIEQAAGLCGQTLSEFAKSVLTSKAAEVIQKSRVTELTDEEWRRFMRIVDSTAAPNTKLKRAAKRYKARRG